MSDKTSIQRHAVDLAWSLWTELGIPGVVRRHASLVVDPEPLLVATPELARNDQRLLDEILRWWATHEDRLSVSRVAGLAAALSPRPREEFARFSSLRNAIPEVAAAATPARHAVRERPPSRLPIERPALLRLRMRALCGVGARADVLTALLLGGARWVSASELATSGYSKRTVARILTELADAGMAARRPTGNALRFRIANGEALSRVVADEGLKEPAWSRVFFVATTLSELARLDERPIAVRRVAAHSARESLAPACAALDWEAPPATRGIASAWDDVMAWGSALLARVASGEV